jgi:hypothetical protein
MIPATLMSELPIIALIVFVVGLAIFLIKQAKGSSSAGGFKPSSLLAAAKSEASSLGATAKADAQKVVVEIHHVFSSSSPAAATAPAAAPAAGAAAADPAAAKDVAAQKWLDENVALQQHWPVNTAGAATAAPMTAQAAQAAANAPAAVTWPHLITVDGIQIMADAPINPNWKAPMLAHMVDTAGHFGFEPSNGNKAVPPQPLRSAAGYPLKYALAQGGAVVGTPSVLYGEESFNSDAEVAAYIANLAAHAPDPAKAAAGWAAEDAALKAQAQGAGAAKPTTATGLLAATYPSAAALTAAIQSTKFDGAVVLDGKVINNGFGKADGSPWTYTTALNGTVSGG